MENKELDFNLNLFGNWCLINGIKLENSNQISEQIVCFLNSEYYAKSQQN